MTGHSMCDVGRTHNERDTALGPCGDAVVRCWCIFNFDSKLYQHVQKRVQSFLCAHVQCDTHEFLRTALVDL